MRWSKRCCSRFEVALYFAAVRAALRPHFSYLLVRWIRERAFVSRLFYPTLFLVTAVLAAMLWTRHGLPIEWLAAIDVRTAWGQAADGGGPSRAAGATTAQNRSQPDRYGREGGVPSAFSSPPVRRRRGYTSLRRSPSPPARA